MVKVCVQFISANFDLLRGRLLYHNSTFALKKCSLFLSFLTVSIQLCRLNITKTKCFSIQLGFFGIAVIIVSLCNPEHHWSTDCIITFTTLGENSDPPCLKSLILGEIDPLHCCPPTQHFMTNRAAEERRWCTDEQNSMKRTECTHTHRLSQHAGAHRPSRIERWAP